MLRRLALQRTISKITNSNLLYAHTKAFPIRLLQAMPESSDKAVYPAQKGLEGDRAGRSRVSPRGTLKRALEVPRQLVQHPE